MNKWTTVFKFLNLARPEAIQLCSYETILFITGATSVWFTSHPVTKGLSNNAITLIIYKMQELLAPIKSD